MNEVKKETQDEKVECDVCLKQVPISEAKSEEATDYMVHFCGLECYKKWKEQEVEKKN